jgi:hypothetical protein
VGIGNAVTDNWRLEVLGARVSSGGGYAVAAFRDSTAYNTSDNGAGITFQGLYNSSGSYTNFATIQAAKLDNTDGNYNTVLKFLTRANGSSMAEGMRIDQDQNVLVGKSSTDSDANGVELLPNGTVYITANNTLPFYINRRGTSGNNEFARFSDDGATRGTIASSFDNELTISASGTNSSGILFSQSNQVRPMKNGSASDSTQDLGTGNGRWKDLYLSGNLIISGAGKGINFAEPTAQSGGTSQILDSYEEGTWLPVMKDGAANQVITSGTNYGYYTKIGRLVRVNGTVERNTGSSFTSTLVMNDLPFTSANVSSNLSIDGAAWSDHASGADPTALIYVGSNDTRAYFKTMNGSAAYWTSDLWQNGRPIYFSFSYMTA